jgi:hypothetical protein
MCVKDERTGRKDADRVVDRVVAMLIPVKIGSANVNITVTFPAEAAEASKE